MGKRRPAPYRSRMPALATSVGALIREARSRSGLTQAQLAEKCGIATTEISKYENGHRTPSLESLDRLAEALGLSTLELLGASDVAASGDVQALDQLLRGRSPSLRRAVMGAAKALIDELE